MATDYDLTDAPFGDRGETVTVTLTTEQAEIISQALYAKAHDEFTKTLADLPDGRKMNDWVWDLMEAWNDGPLNTPERTPETVARKYLEEHPGRHILAIKEIRTEFGLNLLAARNVVWDVAGIPR
jgi:hypothetical protein